MIKRISSCTAPFPSTPPPIMQFAKSACHVRPLLSWSSIVPEGCTRSRTPSKPALLSSHFAFSRSTLLENEMRRPRSLDP
eukprot:1344354-Rhodomonas_salina.2